MFSGPESQSGQLRSSVLSRSEDITQGKSKTRETFFSGINTLSFTLKIKATITEIPKKFSSVNQCNPNYEFKPQLKRYCTICQKTASYMFLLFYVSICYRCTNIFKDCTIEAPHESSENIPTLEIVQDQHY